MKFAYIYIYMCVCVCVYVCDVNTLKKLFENFNFFLNNSKKEFLKRVFFLVEF